MTHETINPNTLFPSVPYGFSQIVTTTAAKTVYLVGQTTWNAERQIQGADVGRFSFEGVGMVRLPPWSHFERFSSRQMARLTLSCGLSGRRPRTAPCFAWLIAWGVVRMRLDFVFPKIADLPSPLGAGHPLLLALFNRETTLDQQKSTLDHLAFEIPAHEYGAELARFQAEGMVLRERIWRESLDWPGRSFFFRDPEGNVIELIAALEE